MDLGIAGRKAIVCASSRGLGRACAEALAAEGVSVVLNGIDPARLESVAAEVRAAYPKVEIKAVVADVTTAQGRAALLAACPEPDMLINNVGGPPVMPPLDATETQWLSALNNVLMSAVLLTRAVVPGMVERGFGRVINITSGQVTAPRGEMTLSAAPRAALTAFMKGLSLDVMQHNVTINNLLPERFATDRQRDHARRVSIEKGIPLEQALRERGSTVAAKRLGEPVEFGATCAFYCSAHAGYMSGQNVHLDGGSYPGLV
jgi:3-oxoacyl-[acyl-carrier protein] reductase